MKKTLIIKVIDKIYPSMFPIVVFVLLITFVSSTDLTISTIPTNFRWRKDLIAMYTSLRFKLGDRIYNGAVVGKDGWFFFTGNKSINDYQKVDVLKTKTLSNLQIKLDRLNADLRKNGITLLLVIPPNKSTIYSQYMPAEIPVLGRQSSLDQFVEYMKHNGNTLILDLRPMLLDASRSRNIYYKTDTHWNAVGAYYGYVAIMHTLAFDYPFLVPHPISDFQYKYASTTARDLPLLIDLSNYEEENWILVPKFEVNLKETSTVLPYGVDYTRIVTNRDGQLPKLLVFHDSFYGPLAHFIEPHFSSVVTIPFTNEKRVWSLDWIQRENPDIVIIEVVERYLDVSLPMLLDN